MSELRFSEFSKFLERINLTDRISNSDIFILKPKEIPKSVLREFSMYRNEFYEINIFNGLKSFRYAIDGDVHSTNGEPSLFFACPEQLQSYEAIEEPAESATGYLIYIQKSFFKRIESATKVHFFKREYKSYYQISKQDYQKIIFWADLMHDESKLASDFESEILYNLLTILLLKIKEVVHDELECYLLQDRPQEIIGKLIDLIDKSPTLPKVSQCAHDLALSPKQLNTLTKQVLGKTTGEVIKGQFNEKAKALLIQSELSIKEIAQQLGFKEVSNFSRFFKRINKVSPYYYREQKGAN